MYIFIFCKNEKRCVIFRKRKEGNFTLTGESLMMLSDIFYKLLCVDVFRVHQVPSSNYITISSGILIYYNKLYYAYKIHIGPNLHGATTPRRSIVINQLMQCGYESTMWGRDPRRREAHR
jgi:hypothetical protein